MCIIIYKPAGKDLPIENYLETAYKNNGDGVGYMLRIDGRVYIKKGMMELDEFKTEMEALRQRYTLRDIDVVLHFRVRTTGAITQGNCHPFPLSSDVEALRMLDGYVDTAIAHNGILPLRDEGDASLSDTMVLVRKLAGLSMEDVKKQLSKEIKSHGGCFALMSGSETLTYGRFITDGGIQYSNSSYYDPPKRIYEPYYYYPQRTRQTPIVRWNDRKKVKCCQCGRRFYWFEDTEFLDLGNGEVMCRECLGEYREAEYEF